MAPISRHSSTLAALLPLLSLMASCASVPTPPPAEPVVTAPPAPAVEQPEHRPNTLRWTTASEVDNFGFDVYRGDSEEGPFERLTERPIPGAGTTDLTSEYSWQDLTNDPHKTYYYYVESISLEGVREQFTPIIKAKPKLPADETAATEDDDSR